MATESPLFNILEGPGKFELMAMLFAQGANKCNFVLVGHEANLLRPRTQYIITSILSVEKEDGSYESWNITGNLKLKDCSYSFKGYYSTRTRKGNLRMDLTFKMGRLVKNT